MDWIQAGIPGTFPCADNVEVKGSTEEGQDVHLLETVEKACWAGLKPNPNKCFIKKQQIKYFGCIITPQGVQLCPKKVRGITALVAPKEKQELQNLLGTMNFMSTFIPKLTKKTHCIFSLLKRDIHFIWPNDMHLSETNQFGPSQIAEDAAASLQVWHSSEVCWIQKCVARWYFLSSHSTRQYLRDPWLRHQHCTSSEGRAYLSWVPARRDQSIFYFGHPDRSDHYWSAKRRARSTRTSPSVLVFPGWIDNPGWNRHEREQSFIPKGKRLGTLSCLHDAHQGLTSMLQHARCTVYWPKI